MVPRFVPLFALLALPACTLVEGSPDEFGRADSPARLVTPEQVAERAIDTRDVRRRMRFLAEDDMRGRDTPSPELERAAAWIAEEFRKAGLEPAGDQRGFLQYWPYERVALNAAATNLGWRAGGRTASLDYGRDFAAVAGAQGGEGAVVFLGKAEDAPRVMQQAAGKVAVVLLSGGSIQEWRWPITVRRNLITGAREGARAVVFILDSSFGAGDIAAIARQFETPTQEAGAIPLFFVRREAGRELISAAGGDLTALAAAAASGEGEPVPLERARVSVAAPISTTSVQVPNVVAVLPGSDTTRAEEYVILTAHFDHVGVGVPDESGDSIYNGADDNASGTAALVEIAQAFGALPVAPARPVLFLATSGEEKGLLGAIWFARNPTVFLSGAVANLNMDMVGRNHPDSLVLVGYDYSTLGPLIDRVAAGSPALRLHPSPDPAPEQNLFQRSDHYPFAQRGIPAVAVTSFLHADYHLPSDELNAIDYDKVTRIARLVFLTAYELASANAAAEWTEEGKAAVRR